MDLGHYEEMNNTIWDDEDKLVWIHDTYLFLRQPIHPRIRKWVLHSALWHHS